MAEKLNPDGIPVYVDDVVLTTPGLSGVAEVLPQNSPGMRGAEDARPAFLAALSATDMSEKLTIEIRDHTEQDLQGGTRGSQGGAVITAEVPAPGEGFGQVMLYAAEDGSLSWHLPEPVEDGSAAMRGQARQTYHVSRAIAPAAPAGASGQRGILGAVGSKLLKVLVFPLVDPLIGEVANHYAGRWEKKNRPQSIRWFLPSNYGTPKVDAFARQDFARLQEGISLLFIHGLFSTAHGAFGALPPEIMQQLHDRYQGRVFALNLFTISITPTANMLWLGEALRAAQKEGAPPIKLDVVTHSRGGLVGRALTEWSKDNGLDALFEVRNLVMVAPPNAGTTLADNEHLSNLLDRITNLTQLFPDNGVTDTIEVILTIVKQIAVSAFGGLDGIMSMDPEGEALAEFNGRSPGSSATYRVITSNYEPKEGTPLWGVVRNAGTDIVFDNVPNDLVVPTEGAFIVENTRGFPVHDPLVFGPRDGVDHNGFFDKPQVGAKLLEWLPGA